MAEYYNTNAGSSNNPSGISLNMIDMSNFDWNTALQYTASLHNPREEQTITISDIISEGPIHGLVGGNAGVYLNNSPIVDEGYTAKLLEDDTVIRLLNGSKKAGIIGRNNFYIFPEDSINPYFGTPNNRPDRVFFIRSKTGTPVKTVMSTTNSSVGSYKNNYEWGLEAPDNASNWYQDSWLFSGTAINEEGTKGITMSTFRPARLKHTSTGVFIEGHLTEVGANHPVSGIQNKRIIFRPGSFLNSTFYVNPNKYREFEDLSTDYELFIDTVVTATEFPTATVLSGDAKTRANSQGFHPAALAVKEQDVTLVNTWNSNPSVTFSGSQPSNGSITSSSHGFETGDEVVYTNTGSGSNIGGLTPFDGTDHTKGIYYIIKTSANAFKIASTLANAHNNTHIAITDGSGSGHILEKGTYKFSDLGFQISNSPSGPYWLGNLYSNIADVEVQFRSGRLQQEPFMGPMGIGATAITNEINQEINQTDKYGGDQAPIEIVASSSQGLNLTSATIPEVDSVRLRFKYQGGLKAVNGDGKDKHNLVSYKITIQVKRPNDTGFGEVLQTISSDQNGKTSNAAVSEVNLGMWAYKPFEDFKLTVFRMTSAEKPSYKSRGENDKFTRSKDWQNISRCQISSASSVFTNRQNYPLTAMARVSFSSQAHGNVPNRSYHCKGMIIKVPSNYVTREESRAGTASYTRRAGVDCGVATDWDGTFREAYTNNPAWIFYDIVTNNRYGLGDFVKETDIDKYSLYRIGRYCDELVPDGKGGTEPRYTLNTYLTKSTDAYKVLKDLATNFLSMVYYLNGKIFLVQDAPDMPTHSFSKANVIDGAFQYESTGSKTRTNQINVIWNNPNNHYKPEPLIIEDRRNISETGQIINKEATAVGCTSEGQATRYGRWKLWTAINQNEVVSFKTGTEGSFIAPGEIVLVQDSDRNSVRLSGRVSGKLIDNLTETATYSGAIGGSDSGFTATQRAQPAVFSGIAVLPSSFSNSAEVLFEHGGTGTGTLVGMVDVSGTKKLLVRSGQGTAGSTASDTNQVVKFINISDIPEFDDQSHRVTLEVHPTATGGGSVRFWIDNRLVVNETTTGSNFNSNIWSGGEAGGWGERSSSIAGYDSTTTPTNSNFQNWSGALHSSLSVYSNQTVSTFPTTTTIPLDSSVTLSSGSTYELSLMYSKHSAFNRDSTSPSYQVEGRYNSSTSTNILTLNVTNGNSEVHKLIKVGMSVSGTGIASNTTVTAVGENTVTMNQNGITSNFSGTLLTFAGGTYSAGELVTYAYIDDNNDLTATFQEINTSEKASNARGTPSSNSFLNLTFSEESRVQTRPVSTSAGVVSALTVSKSFSDIPEAEAIWVLTETNSEGEVVAGSGKKYKVLTIAQEQNDQYSITAAEYYDEKYAAVEEEFTTYVPHDALRDARIEEEVPKPVDAWSQVVRTPIATEADTVIVHWTPAEDAGDTITQMDGTETNENLFKSYRGGAGVEISHNFPGVPSPVLAQNVQTGRTQFVFPEVEEGLYTVDLRTISDRGRKSLPVHLEISVDEKLKRREAGFFPEALHGGASSNKGTEIV